MNRIYQGRITRIERRISAGAFEPCEFAHDQSTCPLWKHHEIFQDAVNYYLLALASMAREEIPGADRLMRDLPKKIADSWECFPKPDGVRAGAKSLRDSVAPWLGLDRSATLDQANSAITHGVPADAKTISYALALILETCSGESGIQQGGREYLPKLCDTECTATYRFSESSRKAGEGKDRLAAVLHSDSTDADIRAIAAEMDLSWTVKVEPGKFYEGTEAMQRIQEAIDHLSNKMLMKPSDRLTALLKDISDPKAELAALREAVKKLPQTTAVSKNRGGNISKDLLFASIAFMAFPSRLTAACLRIGVKAPAKVSKRRSDQGIDFGALGDDPLKKARGERGYVFRAFTALPAWSPKNPGKPTWKEFDIAAFKEALKALNQFRQKTAERELKKRNIEGLLAYLIGSPIGGWKPSKAEESEDSELPDPLDPELLALGWDLQAEMTLGITESVLAPLSLIPIGEKHIPFRQGGWTLTHAALRGLRELVVEWNRVLAEHGCRTPTTQLIEAVKQYQAREGKAAVIGSVGLFLTLCEPKFRRLWQDLPTDEDENRFLFRFAELNDDIAEYIRCEKPINLTPAEPRHSRRLFMFSDLNGKSKVEYHGDDCAEVSLATLDGGLSEKRFRLIFSAPRLHRDGLLGSEDGWLQPITKALGFKLERPELPSFDSAVSLMPDFDRSGRMRFLLNFPVPIDAEPIRRAVGKCDIWDRQLNGDQDVRIHLHWPGTVDEAKINVEPWWKNPDIHENGFTVLATDLGQRTAGAWALVRVTCSKPGSGRPIRSIGHDGKREWFAEVLNTGMHRLPGEDAFVRGEDGKMSEELSGKRGRMAREEEWREAIHLATELLADEPKNWVGSTNLEKSFPEQNNALLALANRRLSRLRTFHRWSCFAPDKESDPTRRASLFAKLSTELAQWENNEVKRWAAMLAVGDAKGFTEAAKQAFMSCRSEILPSLVKIANRVAPLRDHQWEWKARKDAKPYGELVQIPRSSREKPLIRGQRGLSMARIEQLENLRRLFLRYNRALDREAGEPAKFGGEDKGRFSGEPCHDLLTKIEHLKEQRVDQTAHLILAQALGVKLAPHTISSENRERGDHHGEYTRIPGRHPVDLVVIENLSRYLASQGRAPSENSRLMKWAHRAIRDKVKMLIEEPFGIPVVEVAAAYSSRFSASTGEPGARCEERSKLDPHLIEILTRRAEASPSSGQPDFREAYGQLLKQFDKLKAINAVRLSAGEKNPATLLLPKTGGPLFLPVKGTAVVQSDMNAAINLALRAIAAPRELSLIHRLRAEYKEAEVKTVAKNKREIAAYGRPGLPIRLKGAPSGKVSGALNFFYDGGAVGKFDTGSIVIGAKPVPVASGAALWRAVNEMFLPKIVELNNRRLLALGAAEKNSADPDDQIPM
jgi:hypothetical protein